jgi:16S rRNA (uracil1498-N3)-methyltransferase
MARRRFFVPEIRNGVAALTGPQAHHAARVLRVEKGQRFEVSDNLRVYLAEVVEARQDRVSLAILEGIASVAAPVRLALLVSLIKFDRFEWILEKGTELGVERFQPVVAERSEPGLSRGAQNRLARWRRICRRDHLPEVDPPVAFAQAIATACPCRFLLDEEPEAPEILSQLPAERSSTNRVALLTGPEGGWTEAERSRALDSGWAPVSLGPRVLRAETAAIAALAILDAAWRTAKV